MAFLSRWREIIVVPSNLKANVGVLFELNIRTREIVSEKTTNLFAKTNN